jgi:hypothetical protein
MNRPVNGGSGVRGALFTGHSLPESFVQRADLLQEPDPVAVFEVQQLVQAPVQVVGQVRDLPPELVDGVTC